MKPVRAAADYARRAPISAAAILVAAVVFLCIFVAVWGRIFEEWGRHKPTRAQVQRIDKLTPAYTDLTRELWCSREGYPTAGRDGPGVEYADRGKWDTLPDKRGALDIITEYRRLLYGVATVEVRDCRTGEVLGRAGEGLVPMIR